jgi:hypothetical protein
MKRSNQLRWPRLSRVSRTHFRMQRQHLPLKGPRVLLRFELHLADLGHDQLAGLGGLLNLGLLLLLLPRRLLRLLPLLLPLLLLPLLLLPLLLLPRRPGFLAFLLVRGGVVDAGLFPVLPASTTRGAGGPSFSAGRAAGNPSSCLA